MAEAVSSQSDDGVVLIAEDKAIRSSRTKLCSSSKYFQAMFSSENSFIENNSAEITIKNVSHGTLQTLVDYAEVEESYLQVDTDNAFHLLNAASMLQFDRAIGVVEQFALKNLNPDSCLEAFISADNCGLNNLYNKSKAVALWCFEEVRQNEAFVEIPIAFLKEYISDETLNVKTEFSVYEAIERWINYDKTSRADAFYDLFACLRIGSLSQSEIEEIRHKDLVSQHKSCQEMLSTRLAAMATNSDHDLKLSPRHVPEVMLVVGGEILTADKTANSCVLMLSKDNEFTPLAKLPADVGDKYWGQQSCVLGQHVYIIGGKSNSNYNRPLAYNDDRSTTQVNDATRREWAEEIWRYDSLLDTWEYVTSLPKPRRHHTVLATDMYLYVIGGFSKYRILQDTVSRYHIINDTWEHLPKLNNPVVSPAACVYKDELYVFKYNLEVLRPGALSWQQVSGIANIPFEIGIHSALTVDNYIYIMGVHSRKLIKFSPEEKCVTEVGLFSNDVGYGCLKDGRIFAVLGELNDTIETYDLKSGTFDVMCKFSFCLKDHCVSILPKYPSFR